MKHLLVLVLFFSNFAYADKFVPYFASVKSSEVNVRKGPHTRYPISWVFKKKGEPVEVIAEFEHWKRIKDVEGDEGWVKSIMLTKKRTAVIVSSRETREHKIFINVYKKPESSSNLAAKIETMKRVSLKQCKKEWCRIEVNQTTGWIEKKFLWGVYANEEFKK